MVERQSFDKWLQDFGDNFNVRGDTLVAKFRLFWTEFSAVKDRIWEVAAKNILQGDERFPTIARMKEALIDASRGFGDDRKRTSCDKCDGSGLISTVKQCGTYQGQPLWSEFSFRCTCANGVYASEKIEVWHDNYRHDGYVLKTEFDGLGGFEMENGDYIAPHEEQRERMKMLRRIEDLLANYQADKARDLLCVLDRRIDDFRNNDVDPQVKQMLEQVGTKI